jgi:hypothetical protein
VQAMRERREPVVKHLQQSGALIDCSPAFICKAVPLGLPDLLE